MKPRFSVFTILAVLCVINQPALLFAEGASSVPNAATGPSWTPAGFGGAGNFDGVFFDPQQPGVVYATSDVTGVFRSTDHGDHWEMRSAGLGNYEISSFAVDPFDANTLYAGAGALADSKLAGIYVSHDAGLTWQHLASTFNHQITFRRYRTLDAIAPDPTQPGVLLSGSRQSGLWRSTDHGQSWTQVYAAPLTDAPLFNLYDDDPPAPYPAPVAQVVFDPVNPQIVYAGLDGFGVIKSLDGGLQWQPVSNGLPAQAAVKSLTAGINQVLYAAVGPAGVYKSSNGGATWQPVNGGLPALDQYERTWAQGIVVHPTNPGIAHLTLASWDSANAWKTTDGGATWIPTPTDLDHIVPDPVHNPTHVWQFTGPDGLYYPSKWAWQMAMDPHDPNRLFYVTFWDIVRSEDGGGHWAHVIRGAQNTCVTDVQVDDHRPAGQPPRIFAAHMDAGLLASTDFGATWTAILPSQATAGDSSVTGHSWRLAIARNGNDRSYYLSHEPWDRNQARLLRSSDGVNWTVVFSRPWIVGDSWMTGALAGVAVDPATPTTVYVTQGGGQVWTSTQSGDPGTWAPTPAQPLAESGAATFTQALAVDAQHRIFAGTINSGLWRSTDGGSQWQRVLEEQGTIWQVVAAADAVYAATGDSNLYGSRDGGATWDPLMAYSDADDGDGVGQQGRAIAVDPRNSQHLLFGRTDPWHHADAGAGLVESWDGGATWQPANEGLRNLSVNSLAFSAAGELFAGTSCGGVWRRAAAYTLTINEASAGSGTVTGTGIYCGGDCTESYASGTTVTLTATPANGSTFTGWSGACSGTGACTITMDAAKSVTATFTPVATVFRTVAGTISWFYAAAFSRTPIPHSGLPDYGDIGGLAFWTQTYLAGEGALAVYRGNVYAIADFIVVSGEFQARYPASLTHEQFVTALYNNMLGRAPDAGGLAFWVGQLTSGASRGRVLADFTNSDENRNVNPLRKTALESYIVFIDADGDKVMTPEEAAVWLAEHPDLDGAIVDRN